MAMINVWAEQRRLDSGIRRVLTIESDVELRNLRKNRIFYDIPEGITAKQKLLDAYVAPMVMLAMSEKTDVFFSGPVSRAMLYNAHEFMEAWATWRPDTFSRVGIDAESIVESPRRGPARAIQAFSGGLDALFTTWTHKIGGPPVARRPLDAGLLIHGFDIALDDETSMQMAFDKGKLVLDSVDVQLYQLKTNLKKAIKIDWEMFHGAAIASALMQFSKDFDQGLIGSSGPYDSLEMPWGSNPLTDHLAGGAIMDIVHDGAGHSRNDKINAIASWPLAGDNLRVCWRNADASANCGLCEKCIRTALGFLAFGHPIPKSLKADITVADILACRTTSKVQAARFRELRDLAIMNGITAPWVDAIGMKLQAKPPSKASAVESRQAQAQRAVVDVISPSA